MDFFLSGPCPLAKLGERPDHACAQVYSDEEVIRFFEDQCGLSRERPVPGAIFDTHDKALDFWKARLEDGNLTAPFEVVHVDTHSDLAFGAPGPNYVLNVVLTRAPEMRAQIEAYRNGTELDEANYLLFALAFRWISRLTYVRNPKSYQDVRTQLLNPQGDIHLLSPVAMLLGSQYGSEPVVPFYQVDDYRTFRDKGFDFVTMAQSPRYAPQAADRIMDLLRPYIIETPF